MTTATAVPQPVRRRPGRPSNAEREAAREAERARRRERDARRRGRETSSPSPPSSPAPAADTVAAQVAEQLGQEQTRDRVSTPGAAPQLSPEWAELGDVLGPTFGALYDAVGAVRPTREQWRNFAAAWGELVPETLNTALGRACVASVPIVLPLMIGYNAKRRNAIAALAERTPIAPPETRRTVDGAGGASRPVATPERPAPAAAAPGSPATITELREHIGIDLVERQVG